jgi:large subunit ribosomal protein L35
LNQSRDHEGAAWRTLFAVTGGSVPKIKTHRGAAKRFKGTAKGKFVRGHAFARHILTSKNSKRKRNLDQTTIVDKSDQGRLRQMLPYA